MVVDKKIVPFRGASEAPSPTSAVMPVARKASGAGLVSPVELHRRAYRDLTDAAAKAYDAAAVHRAAGDASGAALLVAAAAEALRQAQCVGEEIARL